MILVGETDPVDREGVHVESRPTAREENFKTVLPGQGSTNT